MRFDDMVQAAEMLSESTIVPMNYRRVNKKGEENPSAQANILAVMFAGQDYGWNPMTAMRLMNVIEGNAALKPEAILGLARQAGHAITFEFAPDEVVAHGKRCDTGDEASASFSMRDAARAGLSHKDVWKKYPEDMMMWRAISKLGRRLFSDLMLGASYTAEELGGAMPEAELMAARPIAGLMDVDEAATLADPPAGNLAPSLALVKEEAEAVEVPQEEVDIGAVIESGDAKAQLITRVAAQLGKDEESDEAINAAREIWQEEVGLGARHITMTEMAALLARVDEKNTEAF